VTTAIAVRKGLLSLLPSSISELGDHAGESFVDFFTAQIRNPNTRAAYFRNVTRFLAWIEEQGLALRQVRAVHVAAYVELLGLELSAPSVKQYLAAIRMLGAFLVVRQVIPSNPALDVRGPKHVVLKGKTPVLSNEDARALFASIDTSTPAGTAAP
jgi:site-specific recombinase XerD